MPLDLQRVRRCWRVLGSLPHNGAGEQSWDRTKAVGISVLHLSMQGACPLERRLPPRLVKPAVTDRRQTAWDDDCAFASLG